MDPCAMPVKSWMIQILIIISSFYNVEGQYQLIGPSQAVLAKEGDDVILPCRIEPPRSAARMTVDWSRPDLKPVFVHVRQEGRKVPNSLLNPLYQQRTSLFAEELPHGNISLKLSGVQLSDEGKFKCFVPTLHNSSLIQLLVGAVSQPVIGLPVIGPKDDGFALTCVSGCWYPEPEVSWLDSGGNLLPADPSVTVRASSHCYTVQRNLTLRGAGDVTCRVHLPHINHTVDIHSAIPAHNSTQPTGKVNATQPTDIAGFSVIHTVIFIGNCLVIGLVLAIALFCLVSCIAYCLSMGSEENGGDIEKGRMLGERND